MLTLSQYQTLKTFIETTAPYNTIQNDEDGDFAIRDLLNELATPAFKVWNTETPVTEVLESVDFSKYTPNDLVPTDTQLNVEIWKARAQSAQIKLDVLWSILDVNSGFVNASKAKIRDSLRDATIGVRTGASGAPTAPGGANAIDIMTACTRNARVIEKVLNTGNQTTGAVTAAIMGYVGDITKEDVGIARRST
jgi:hypothetical protein